MRHLKFLLAMLALLAFAGAVHARSDELADPAPIAIPGGLTDKQINREIQRSLLSRGWRVSDSKPGQIDSVLNLREHEARIRISWDDAQVRIAYVGSVNLDYKEKRGKRYIHSNYLNWMNYLQNDIYANLAVAKLGDD